MNSMSISSFFVVFILLSTGCLSRGENAASEPYGENLVVIFLRQIIAKIPENFFLSEINLGEIGKFTNVSFNSEGLNKSVSEGGGFFGFDLKIKFKQIKLDGKYDIKEIVIGGMPIFGKGPFEISTGEVELNFATYISKNFITDKMDVEVENLKLRLEDANVNIENLMNDIWLSNFLNELINSLIPDIVEMISNEGAELLTAPLNYIVNGVIDCVLKEPNDLEECIMRLFKFDKTMITYLKNNFLRKQLIEPMIMLPKN